MSRSATGHWRSPLLPRRVAVVSPPCQRYPGAVLPSWVLLLPPLPLRRLTHRQQISSVSSRCSGAASPRSSSVPVTPLPAPLPGLSPRPFQLSPLAARDLCRRLPRCPTRRWRGEAACGRPGARQPGRAAAGACLRSASYPSGLSVPVPPGMGGTPCPRGTTLGATLQRPWDCRTDGGGFPTGAPSPLAAEGQPFARGRAGLLAGKSEPPRPRQAVRKGGRRRSRSSLPAPRAARRARPSTPGSQRPRRADRGKRRPAKLGLAPPPNTARPVAGRGGRGSLLPLSAPGRVRHWPRCHCNLKRVETCFLTKILLRRETLQPR